jgi:CHRD domain
VIATAMAKAKEDRYPTCGDLVAAARAASLDRTTAAPYPAAETVLSSPAATPPPAPPQGPEPQPTAPGETPLPVVAATAAVSTPPPTSAAPPPGPPAPPAPPPTDGTAAGAEPSDRPPSGRRMHLLIALLAAAVVGLGAALAIVLLTRGSSSPSTSPGRSFSVALASSAEVPTSIAKSSGTAKVTFDGTKVCWTFKLSDVSQPRFAHIHMGDASVSGPIVIPLGANYKQNGCTTGNADTVRAILANPSGYYVNVHSVKYPDGVVRGQLVSATPSAGSQAVGLAGVIAQPIFKNCRVTAKPVAGAIQTAECVPPPGTSTVFFPDHLQLSIFPNANAVTAAYNAAKSTAGIGSNFGTCNGTSWLGEGNWFHAPIAAGQPGKLAGRRFCYFDGNVAVIVWTHRKFGQPTHIDFMGIAREGGSDHPDLFSWWRFWHHRLGKCILEGCTAKA